jgi:hypothetical protein
MRALAEEIAAERVTDATESLSFLRDRVKKFEAASGVDIQDWHGEERIGAAVKVVLEGGLTAAARGLESTAERIRQTADDLEKALAEVRRFTGEPPSDRAGSDA